MTEPGKTYLASDLAAELAIPRTTVNDWLRIYAPYLESELRGKRKAYPERTLNILREIREMRDGGQSQSAIEQVLADRYGIRPEPVPQVTAEPEEPAPEAAPQVQEKAPSPEALVRQDPELKELFLRMMEQEQLRQNLARRSSRRLLLGILLVMLLLAGTLAAAVWFLGTRLVRSENLAAERQVTAERAMDAAAKRLEEVRDLQTRSQKESARHAEELKRMADTLDLARKDYRLSESRLKKELAEQKKAADKALEEMRRTSDGKRQAEMAELKRAFAESQQALLKQYAEAMREKDRPAKDVPPAKPENKPENKPEK